MDLAGGSVLSTPGSPIVVKRETRSSSVSPPFEPFSPLATAAVYAVLCASCIDGVKVATVFPSLHATAPATAFPAGSFSEIPCAALRSIAWLKVTTSG